MLSAIGVDRFGFPDAAVSGGGDLALGFCVVEAIPDCNKAIRDKKEIKTLIILFVCNCHSIEVARYTLVLKYILIFIITTHFNFKHFPQLTHP